MRLSLALSSSKHAERRPEATDPEGTSQHAGEVFVDAGAAPYDFDKKNELNFFVRTVTLQGEQRTYWGKDLPRALEEAGTKVGDSITATRVVSKPVTVEEIQEQPDGSKQTVRIDVKRNNWQVDNHGVAARDQAVVELKREKVAAELAERKSQNHTLRL